MVLTKFQELYREHESGGRVIQMGFDESRLNNKENVKTLNNIYGNTLLIPKLNTGGNKDIGKDIESLTSKINNMNNLILKNNSVAK